MSETSAIEVQAINLDGSHIGRITTLAFGKSHGARSLLRGQLEAVKHAGYSDDVELTVVVAGQRLSIDVTKDTVVELA